MALTEKSIDKSKSIPLHIQVKQILMEEINSGNLTPGDMISPEQEISELFRVSRSTVRQAITELVREGYFYRGKGRGTFVSKPVISYDFAKNAGMYTRLVEEKGMKASTKVIQFDIVDADAKIAEILQIPQKQKVIHLIRIRSANEELNNILESYLPHNLCYSIFQHDLEKETLHEALSGSEETAIFRDITTIEATLANSKESRLLQIAPGSPILLISAVSFNRMGKPVEYCIARYRADRNKFITERYDGQPGNN